ncbi:MAG: hypothetical protein KF901_24995, partial [Myxococcales bacterium]|nr:hypothetical protein [Myxococcales bacterium]
MSRIVRPTEPRLATVAVLGVLGVALGFALVRWTIGATPPMASEGHADASGSESGSGFGSGVGSGSG